MRMKQNRKKKYYLMSRKSRKDEEGSTHAEYGEPAALFGEVWTAGGKVQAEIYGERLSYIRNVKIEGEYVITTDRTGVVHYVFPNGLDFVEMDGMCLYTQPETGPDYKIISIKPYSLLRLECEKL